MPWVGAVAGSAAAAGEAGVAAVIVAAVAATAVEEAVVVLVSGQTGRFRHRRQTDCSFFAIE